MSKHFKDRTAVITGAGSGIGRQLAIQLAVEGAYPVISDIDKTGLEITAKFIEALGCPRPHISILDVSSAGQVNAYAIRLREAGHNVCMLFNNAGIGGPAVNFDQYTREDFDRVLNINLHGVIFVTRAFLPDLMRAKEASLVNLSSVFGLVAPPQVSPYVTSKFAVRGFSEALTTELHGTTVRVTTVHPGAIATNIAASAGASEEVQEYFRRAGMSPKRAAEIILKAVYKRKIRIRVGRDAVFLDLLQRFFPTRYRPIINRLLPTDKHKRSNK
ncbi:MAG: SDR family oxidoreductase [Alphaproteobacteria bacterium]|nr:SDR family oxidoreductase [Alphaproteobacteria bacterium]